MEDSIRKIQHSIKRWLLFFMVGLVLSGITAFDTVSGITWLHMHIHFAPAVAWIDTVYRAIITTEANYPMLFYGYDWLAFAHIVIAIAFIGPYKNPIQNQWVIEFGIIACALVIPATIIMGAIRHIPVWWQLIDCWFGFAGIIPLAVVWFKTQQLKIARSVFCHNVIKKAVEQVSHKYQLDEV